MILPMQKVAILVRDKVQNEALEKLREIGVIHLEKRDPSSDSLAKALESKAKADSAVAMMQPYKPAKQKSAPEAAVRQGRRSSDHRLEPYSLDALDAASRPMLVDLLVKLGKERKALQDRDIFLGRERSRIEPWGEWDPEALKELSASWKHIYLYELTSEAFAAIPEDTKYFKMDSTKAAVRLVVLEKEIPGAAVFPVPEKSISGIDSERADIKAKLEDLEEKLQGLSNRGAVLKNEVVQIQSEVDFQTAKAAMEKVGGVPDELGFSYLTGFVPKEDLGRLKRASAEYGWALLADEPGAEDMVPTKLKNNKFASLLYPITDFLEMVPGYREVDISIWFLIFFVIFFGMIFGDAAYGLMLLGVAIGGIIKTAKKGVPAGFKLLLLLSISNIIWGVATCTWFGVDIQYLPQFLKDISFSLISEAKSPEATVSQNLQIFCFSLALIQLTIAHVGGIGRNIKSLKVFAEIGSLAMLWGMYVLILWLVVSNPLVREFPFHPALIAYGDVIFRAGLYLLAGGFALNFVFANYEGSVLKSILSSVKNIITVVLGITNVFSDIMSYIRLWAVGLAGASIAATINTMAGPMLGSFLVFAGVILLVAGHGLNLVLNVLSVLVHGVRLNTLEFSGHVGLTWSGTAYKPFSQTVKK